MPTSYATDIRPLFRNNDIRCMSRRRPPIKLDDAAWLCDPAPTFGFPDHGNARKVYSRLVLGDMPPDGPWSQDKIDTYARWMDDGFHP
jgi:hypothetical protein